MARSSPLCAGYSPTPRHRAQEVKDDAVELLGAFPVGRVGRVMHDYLASAGDTSGDDVGHVDQRWQVLVACDNKGWHMDSAQALRSRRVQRLRLALLGLLETAVEITIHLTHLLAHDGGDMLWR